MVRGRTDQDAQAYQHEVFNLVRVMLKDDDKSGQVRSIELRGEFPDSEVVVAFTTYGGHELTTRYAIWRAWWNSEDLWEHAGDVAGYLETAIIEDLASPPLPHER